MGINKKEQIETELRKRAAYNIVGVSGEYFVAAELSRRGWVAVLTLKNTYNIDLIATTPDGKRTVNIQVKTRSIGNRQGWILNKSIESIMPGKNFYIAFVDLQGIDAKPDYYIIPKNLFAKWIAKRHKDWLAAPGRNGHVRVDNPIRAFDKPQFQFFEKYHNNWDIFCNFSDSARGRIKSQRPEAGSTATAPVHHYLKPTRPKAGSFPGHPKFTDKPFANSATEAETLRRN